MVKPIRVRPLQTIAVLPSDPIEQEARITAIQIVKALVEVYGVDAVCAWLNYAAAELHQAMPCQSTEDRG